LILFVRSVDVRTGGNQHVHNFQAPTTRGELERSALLVIAGMDQVRLSPDEIAHSVNVPLDGGFVKLG
jgi:hypothetical protein